MKTKSMFLFFVTFFFIYSSSAQEPAFTWGIALPKTSPEQAVRFLGVSDNSYYVVTKQPAAPGQFGATYHLEAFNAKHDRIFSKNITPATIYDVAGTAYINNKPVLFSYGFIKDQGGDILYATDYSSNGTAGSPREILRNPADKMSDRGRYNIAQSPSGKYTLVAYEPDFRKGEQEQLQLVLLDEQLNKVWNSTQTLPYEWKRGVNNFIHVNNNGIAFIVKRVVMKGEDNSYSVLSYDGRKLTHHPVDFGEDKKIAAAETTLDEKGNLVTAGYYSEDKKIRFGSTNFNGAFVFAVNAAGDKVYARFTAAFDDKRKDMVLKYIYPVNQGWVLLGQRATESSSLSSDAAKASKGERDTKYYSGDIYADAYDEKGNKLFSKTISRNLDSKNDFGVSNSFFAAVDGNRLRVIFNDEQTRYDGKKHTIIFGWIPLIPVLVNIDITTGEMSKPLGLFNSGGVGGKNAEMRMRPDVFIKTGAARYLLRGENNQLFKMGSILFQ